MAPFLAMTSWQTFRRPSAQAAATRRACCERQMARTRALNAVFPKAGRPRPKNDIGGCVGCSALARAQKCFIVAQHEPRPCSFTGFKLRIAPVSLPRRTQGHKEDREDLEERDSTTRQRLAIRAHSHSVTKTGLSKTVLQETARYHFTTSWIFSASSPFTTRACFLPADGQHRWHVRSGPWPPSWQ